MTQAQQAVLAAIRDCETIRLAQAMVRIPSITGEEGRRLSDFLYDWLKEAGLSPVRQHVPPEPPKVLATSTRSQPPDAVQAGERYNLAAVLKGAQAGPRLLFQGHQDTKWVDGMTISPFGAQIREGRLYGRGAADMKGGLAAMLVATQALCRSKVPLVGELRLCSEVGEEINDTGIEAMDRAGLLDADMAVVGEPTNLAVQIGNRGGYRFQISVAGKAVHSGLAQQGVNAIQKMSAVIAALYGLPMLRDGDPLWGPPTMNVQKIGGGGRWEASVADACAIWVDVRTTPGYPADRVRRIVREMLEGLCHSDPELSYTLKPIGRQRTPQAIPSTDPLVEAALRALRQVRGETPALSACPGITTAARLIARHRMPAIVLGPGDLARAHTRDEWAPVEQIADAARVYALLALDILGAGGQHCVVK